MIFFINGSLQKIDNYNFIINNYQNYKIDEIYVDNLEYNIEKQYYFFRYSELNFKNKIVNKLYCFDSMQKLNLFIELINISGIGINTVENIFEANIFQFIDDLNNLTFTKIKEKYHLREQQVINILKKLTTNSKEIIYDENKELIINNLISLGYSKTKVKTIINKQYDLFQNLEMENIIRKFVEILKNES